MFGARKSMLPKPQPTVDGVGCDKCAGHGVKGFLICKSHCHACDGTGEASKEQLLQLLSGMQRGDVDAAVVLHAASVDKRDDKEIVLAAVQRFPKALQFASKRLQASQELLDAAAEVQESLKLTTSLRGSLKGGLSLSHMSTAASLHVLLENEEMAVEWGSFRKHSKAEPESARGSEKQEAAKERGSFTNPMNAEPGFSAFNGVW